MNGIFDKTANQETRTRHEHRVKFAPVYSNEGAHPCERKVYLSGSSDLQPIKVGNLSRSKHLQHVSEAIEAVHGEIAYPIQRFSRKQRKQHLKGN